MNQCTWIMEGIWCHKISTKLIWIKGVSLPLDIIITTIMLQLLRSIRISHSDNNLVTWILLAWEVALVPWAWWDSPWMPSVMGLTQWISIVIPCNRHSIQSSNLCYNNHCYHLEHNNSNNRQITCLNSTIMYRNTKNLWIK